MTTATTPAGPGNRGVHVRHRRHDLRVVRRRVDKALGKVDGVTTPGEPRDRGGHRRLRPAAVDVDALTAAIAAAGYTGTPRGEHAPATEPGGDDRADGDLDEREARRDAELADLKRKWQVALAAGLGMMILMYVPLPLDAMDWLMPLLLVVSTVVQFWAGRQFYRAAWAAARHRAPT